MRRLPTRLLLPPLGALAVALVGWPAAPETRGGQEARLSPGSAPEAPARPPPPFLHTRPRDPVARPARSAAATHPLAPATRVPEAPRGPIPLLRPTRPPRRRALSDLGRARRALGLEPWQVEAWGRVVAQARRDVDDLCHVRAADGRTWCTVDAQARRRGAGDLLRRLALAGFADEDLAGGETWRAARRRVLDAWREALGRVLTPDQQGRLAAWDTDDLLDGGRGRLASVRPARLGLIEELADVRS